MILLFGLALIIPFPKSDSRGEDDVQLLESQDNWPINSKDKKMWTYRLRNFAFRNLPPHKLLPDRQPAYVSSWIYVFGVASLAAFGLVIGSGLILAIGGPGWWQSSNLGHFVNSVHLWSVELFMAFLVIHLWGKFWMAAWRGKRALTWVLGVGAFLAAIIECFTGYLSQENFASQWIATNGKDAINSTGLGSFFNLLNSGQMMLWHVVLIPIALIALIGAHILMVRVRGVSHPLPASIPKGRQARKATMKLDKSLWRGPTRRYDILKEGTIATFVVFILVLGLAAVLSSPDEPAVTIAQWSKIAPADFMATAASELAGTSETANYGPPYNNGTANVQKVVVSWQLLAGVHQAINSSQTFVITPLSEYASDNTVLTIDLNIYKSASKTQQMLWDNNYLNLVQNVMFNDSGKPIVPKGDDGPVPILISNELLMAQSGVLDADLLAQQPFYGSNYTKPLLFIEDGNYFSSLAQKEHLKGTQWGVMNETGNYPGQPWLWLYTLWYQVPGFSSSANIDLIAVYMTALATGILLAVPFIPGLRDIPRLIPIHRLIWRAWNKSKK